MRVLKNLCAKHAHYVEYGSMIIEAFSRQLDHSLSGT